MYIYVDADFYMNKLAALKKQYGVNSKPATTAALLSSRTTSSESDSVLVIFFYTFLGTFFSLAGLKWPFLFS